MKAHVSNFIVVYHPSFLCCFFTLFVFVVHGSLFALKVGSLLADAVYQSLALFKQHFFYWEPGRV